MKEALDIMKIAKEVDDEVVDRLLHEATEKVLKEDWIFVYLRMYLALVFCRNQTLGLCMYINVIYFFVMHETFVRTVFEPLAKKHLPFFHASQKKKIVLMSLLMKISFTQCNASAEDMSCAVIFLFIIRSIF
jgi:hypothetical protein